MSALGSLVVKLALEYAQFMGGLDKSEQAALAHAKRIQDTFDGIKDKVFSVGTAVAGGLAAAFTVSAFKSLISDSVAAGAALDDLAMQTGSTVEALSGLAEVGKFNDMGPEKIGAAMNMLTRNLAGATEESKGTGAALKALGLDMQSFRALKPEEQMQAVAKALDGVQDGASKSAVMMALYGKEGANMLPFMKDLASVGELQARITTEQAAAAAQLDDNWVRLTTTGSETAKEVAMGMVPALDDAVRAIMDVMSGTGGMRETLRGLVADGSIREWTTTAIKGLSYVADAGQIAWRVLQSIGKGLGGLAAALVQALSGDFRAAWTTLQASGQDMIDVFDSPTIGARFRESLDKMATSTDGAGASAKKATLDFRNLAETSKAAKDPFDALLESIVKRTAAYAAEAAAGEKLTEGEKAAIDVLDQLRTGKVKVTQAQAEQLGKAIELMLAQEKENAQHQEFIKIADAERAARLKIAEAAEQSVAALLEQNQSLREEVELIGLSSDQQNAILQARMQAVIVTKEATLAELERQAAITGTMTREHAALAQEIDLLKERAQLLGQKDLRERESKGWMDFYTSIEQTARSVWTDVADKGMGAFKRIGQTIKASVLDVLWQMTGRRWIINIGTSIFGSGFGTAASAASGGASALSTVGSIGSGYSLLSGLAGTFGGGLSAGFGGLMGTLGLNATGATLGGAMSAGSIAMGAGNIAGGLGTFVGALGPIALGLAAVVSLLGKKSTPHIGGGAAYGADMGLVTGSASNQYMEHWTIPESAYRDEANKAAATMAKTVSTTLDSVAKLFGDQVGYVVGTGYADDSSKDGAWGALRIALGGQTVADWGNPDDKWAGVTFADGEKGAQEYAAKVAATVREVIQGMQLPEWAARIAANLPDGASMDDLTALLSSISAYPAQLLQQFGSDRDSLVQLYVDGLATGDAAAAGQSVADALLTGLRNALYAQGAGQIFDTVNMGIVTPMLDAIATGASVSEALSAASIDATIERAKAQAAAFAELFGNAEFQDALNGMRDAVASALGQAGPALQWLPYTAQSIDVAAQAAASAADEAARAAEEARKRWQDITDALLSDRFAADMSLLRALGREEEAVAAERLRAIDGYDAYQVSLFDGTQAILAQVAALEKQAEAADLARQKAQELAASIASELPAVLDLYRTPAQRTQARYDSIAADLTAAGIGVSGDALAAATKDQIAQAAVAVFNMAETSDTARLALVRAAGALATLKDEAEATAKANDLDALDKAWKAVQRAIGAQRDVVKETIADVTAVFRLVGDSARELYGQVAQTAALQAQEGNAFIARALEAARSTGLLPDSEDLRDAIGAARAGLDATMYATQAEADYERMVLAARLRSLEDVAGDQLSEAERQLKALDDLLESEQAQVDLLRAQLTGQEAETAATLGVMGAVQNLHDLMARLQGRGGGGGGGGGTPAGGAASVLTGPGGSQYDPRSGTFYAADTGLPYSAQDLGAAAIDMVNAGQARDLYDIARANGVTSDMLAAWTGTKAQDLRDWARDQGLPAFAGGGWHSGGWALFGEEGPELAYTPPARIYTAQETARMRASQGGGGAGQGDALLASIDTRLARIEGLHASGNDNTGRTADLIDKVTAGGNAMATETA